MTTFVPESDETAERRLALLSAICDFSLHAGSSPAAKLHLAIEDYVDAKINDAMLLLIDRIEQASGIRP